MVCGFTDFGLPDFQSEKMYFSLKPFSRFDSLRSVPTTLRLKPQEPTEIRLVQGVTRVPEGFDEVSTVQVEEDWGTFCSHSGQEAKARENSSFLRNGAPAS